MQKQEQLVPISDVHRHTDAVQALFSLLLAFLTTFKVPPPPLMPMLCVAHLCVA